MQHRFSAQPADFQGLYPDSAPLAVEPWYAVPVRADVATAPLSFNDYGLNHSLLSANEDPPLLSTDLWAPQRQGWLFSGR